MLTQKGRVRLPERREPRFLGWSEPTWLCVHLGFIFEDRCEHIGRQRSLRTTSCEGGLGGEGGSWVISAPRRGLGRVVASLVTEPSQHWGPTSQSALHPTNQLSGESPFRSQKRLWRAGKNSDQRPRLVCDTYSRVPGLGPPPLGGRLPSCAE